MTIKELITETFAIEDAMTRRILEAVPDDRPAWTPHEKSMPLGKLAMHLATLPGMAIAVLQTPEFDLANWVAPDHTLHSREQLLSTFDGMSSQAQALLASSTEDELSQIWTLRKGDKVLVHKPRAVVLLHMYLGHLIHHRAQLGVYLRLNDIAVPGVYGPSADDKAQSAR